MAVPKKKVSRSKTRKRLLSRVNSLSYGLYTQCEICLNFLKTHRTCAIRAKSKEGVCMTRGTQNRRINNINKLYDINF